MKVNFWNHNERLHPIIDLQNVDYTSIHYKMLKSKPKISLSVFYTKIITAHSVVPFYVCDKVTK